MNIGIVGSRACPPIDIGLYLNERPDCIVSGGANGADASARLYALENNIPIVEYLPDYCKYGRKAPLMRNILIVERSDRLLAFWDGVSKGTKFTIEYAKRRGKSCEVIRVS